MRLIIATKNEGKLREIKAILKGLRLPIISLKALNDKITIRETSTTFFANALKKALAVSKKYPHDLVVGEDSGLEVVYLGYKPGVFSKRYSGKNATDFKNNVKLLKELSGLDKKHRKAYFRCVIALVRDSKLIKKFEGCLSGFIYDKIVGNHGFGYDPIFYLPKYKKTVAQLPSKEKNKVSHRAKAFLKLKKFLANYSKIE